MAKTAVPRTRSVGLLCLLLLLPFTLQLEDAADAEDLYDDLNGDHRPADDLDDFEFVAGEQPPPHRAKDFYSFKVLDIRNNLVDLGVYRGKVALVVNVASECGYTDNHYEALVRIHNLLGTSGRFTVLAFPCNQFGAQEPGSNWQIEKFAKEKYHVNFPMFSKTNVIKNGIPNAWKFLIEETGKKPNWNFWKYLVNADGGVLNAWGPWHSVEDIFHEVKAAVDKVDLYESHGGEL